jgi:hypothetical protein
VVTGWDRLSFGTQASCRALKKLGFNPERADKGDDAPARLREAFLAVIRRGVDADELAELLGGPVDDAERLPRLEAIAFSSLQAIAMLSRDLAALRRDLQSR